VLKCLFPTTPCGGGRKGQTDDDKRQGKSADGFKAALFLSVPLEFLPKVGPKTIDKLIEFFGSEMRVLHYASYEELTKVVSEDIAKNIVLSREGKLSIEAGGGGVYGKIEA